MLDKWQEERGKPEGRCINSLKEDIRMVAATPEEAGDLCSDP